VPTREVERAKLYAWPGNVRELQNVVERAVIIANGGKLRFELPSAMRASAPPSCPVPRETQNIIPESKWRDMERENIITALRQSEGKISGKGGAAELLQLNPGTLASRIKALGIAAKSSAAETSQDQ
jgi:transcriptional regulator with GAF, ATPase, and Fis domain